MQTKLIDADLAKIAKPLQERRVDEMTMKSTENDASPAVISASEKAYFVAQSSTETFQDVTLLGKLISNNTENQTGRFATRLGDRIPYHYIGPHPELFLSTYGASGLVSVSGRAFFDEDLRLVRIDIINAVQNQQTFAFTPEASQALQHSTQDGTT